MNKQSFNTVRKNRFLAITTLIKIEISLFSNILIQLVKTVKIHLDRSDESIEKAAIMMLLGSITLLLVLLG